MERVLYLHFNCYPRQGEINGRHRHIHGDLRPRIQQKFRPWPKETPFLTQGPGCTSAVGVTVLTIVITFVSISLRSTFWAPKAGNGHGKASWHNIWQGSEWHISQNDGNRNQETSSWKHPKYPTPLIMLVTEIGKLSSESENTLQVTKSRALIQQENSGVTQTTELQDLV